MRWKKRVNQSLAIALTVALAFAMNVPIAAWGEVQDPVLDVPGAEPASLAESTAAQQFEALVAELPEANAVTAEDADAVSAAQAAYDALAEDEKATVAESRVKLEAVAAALEASSEVMIETRNPEHSLGVNDAGDAVAQIGDTPYATLQAAIDAALADQVVKVLKDIDLGTGYLYVKSDDNLALDLNGCSVTSACASGYTVYVAGLMSLRDSGTGGAVGTLSNTSGKGSCIYVAAGGSFSLERGTVTGTYGVLVQGGAANAAKANLSGGKVEGTQHGVFVLGNRAGLSDGQDTREPYLAEVAISGSAEIVSTGIRNGAGHPGGPAVEIEGLGAKLSIDGGTIKGGPGYGAVSGNGSLSSTKNSGGTEIQISGGVIQGVAHNYDGGFQSGNGIYHPQAGKLNITGGEITGDTGIEMRAGDVNVSGNAVIRGTMTPTTVKPEGNGSTSDGVGLAIAQHSTKLPINVSVSGGTIEGYSALYESNPEKNPAESIAAVTMDIMGGTFNAISGGAVAVYSEDCSSFISGGTFSSDPSAYIAEGSSSMPQQDGTFVVAEAAVAKIGETVYSSLQEAFDAAENGQTVVLTSDVAVNGGDNAVRYSGGRSFTVDFASHSVTANTSNAAFVVVGGAGAESSVTFKNGTITAGPNAYCTVITGKGSNGEAATVNLEEMTLYNSRVWAVSVKAFAGSSINLTNSSVNSSNGAGGTEAAGGEVNITGCTFNQGGYYDHNSVNVAASNGGVANVYSGTFTAASFGAYIYNSGGTINIKDGSFDAGKAVLKADNSTTANPSVINVSAGDFTGAYAVGDKSVLSIAGGTFSSDPSAYVATGYAATQDGGTWTVAACSFAEMTIDGTAKTYNDPQAFIGDLMGATGKTIGIKMLADVDVDGFIPVAEGQTVTLDMGGKKLTSSYAGSFIRNSGTLTIQGNGIIYTTDIEAQGRHAVENYGALIIENGTFGSNKSRGNAVRNFGTATIKGGTFTACDNFTNDGYAYAVANGSSAYPNATMTVENATVQGNMNGAIACDGGTLTIKNGSYTLGDGTADSLYRLAYVSGNGTVNIEGGTFVRNVKNNHGFFGGGDGNEGTTEGINISGGTFTDQVNEAINFDSGRTRISGGTFNNGLVSEKKATVTVTGGTFAADPLKDGFVADGYVVKPGDGGAFVVSRATDADKIQVTDENGNTVDAVGTMGDAVGRVAETGGTLTLMGDATESAPIAVEPAAGTPSTSVSIDLNGKVLNAPLTIGQNATCIITDKTGVGTVSAAGSNAAVEVSGALVVDGATIVGAGTSGVKVNPGASLTVNGGEVQAQTQPATFSLPLAAAATAEQYGIEATGTQDNPSTVTISAGKVLGATGALSVGENVTTDITGGTFSHSVASLLASGYAESEVGGLFYVAKDGMYEVSAYKADPADSATWAYPDGAQGQVFAGWYADSAFRTPFTAASGQAYARFVNVSETITFKGGSLRMDGDPSASTSLRFGYSFKIPQQATYVKSGWTYRNANLGKEVDVPTRVWAFNDTGFFDANMVITNIPTSSYAWEMTSQMYVYYETADGTTVRAEEAAPQSRSAQSVAQFIVDSSFAPTVEKEYAQKILVAIV